jgi:hypothetical protein
MKLKIKTQHGESIREIRRCLRERSPENWLLRIEMIKDPDVREKIAKIVWWDYFASKPIGQGYNYHLDEYSNRDFNGVYIKPEDMAVELKAIGYVWKDVIRRMKVYNVNYNENIIAKREKKGKYG